MLLQELNGCVQRQKCLAYLLRCVLCVFVYTIIGVAVVGVSSYICYLLASVSSVKYAVQDSLSNNEK
jgi:hypothetical protein